MRGSRWVIFKVTELVCALSAADVRRVLHIPRLSCPPGIPSAVAGFMDVAGTAIPVLRLDRLFDLPESEFHPYLCVLVLKTTDRPLALLVDRVDAVVGLHEHDIVPVQPQESFNACVFAKAVVDGRDVALLSAERLLSRREQHLLVELQDMEQRRLVQMGEAI